MKQACPARMLTASTVTFSSIRIEPLVDSISEYVPEFWMTRLPGVLIDNCPFVLTRISVPFGMIIVGKFAWSAALLLITPSYARETPMEEDRSPYSPCWFA